MERLRFELKYQNESFQIFGILNLFFKNRFIMDKILQDQSIKCVCVSLIFRRFWS